MLSGIGPGEHLRSRGIEVFRHMPGVGRNLQDHLDFIYTAKTRDTDVLGLGAVGTYKLIRDILRWRRDGSGIVATPGAEAGAFIKSDPELPGPTCSCISSARWLTIIRANCIGATAIHAMSAF
jgi:choline dehydrogenase-like flavoprotein